MTRVTEEEKSLGGRLTIAPPSQSVRVTSVGRGRRTAGAGVGGRDPLLSHCIVA